MTEIRALIQHLVDAGVDPIDAAEVITRAAILGASSFPRAKSAGAIRQDRYRRNKASQVTLSDDCTPRPPALDKETPPTPPKEINPTPLTPQTSLNAGRDGDDLARLSERLCDAADGKIQPQSAIVVGPILEMLAHGVDLETDVLPAIAAASKRLTSPAKLTYFLGPIRDAYNRRIEAGKGLSKPKPSTVKRPEDMTDGERRTRLAKFLNMARGSGIWLTWMHGPPPGRDGCRIPADMLEPRDLRIDWMEEKHPEAA